MELGSGLGTSYPTALDIDDTLEVNAPNVGKTKARAEVANDLAAAILAIETELGTSPSGTATNVKLFLQTEHNTNGTHKSITTDTLSVSGQITSTLADGTAPLVVTSTTKVDNLNADIATNSSGTGTIPYASETGLKILRGSINSDGTIAAGSGFTCVHTGTGQYAITYGAAFASKPSVVASVWNTNGFIDVYSSTPTTTIGIFTINTSLANADMAFEVIIIGPLA